MFNKNFYLMMQSLASSLFSNTTPKANLVDTLGVTRNSQNLHSDYGYYNTFGFAITNINSNQCGFPSLYILNNATRIYYGNSSHLISDSGWQDANFGGVFLGDGDTLPTVNDINLAGNRLTDFTATTSASAIVGDEYLTLIGTYNITNVGASNMTIKEVGLFTTPGGGSSHGFMVERSVLPTPLVIEPNAMKTLVYKIYMGKTA